MWEERLGPVTVFPAEDNLFAHAAKSPGARAPNSPTHTEDSTSPIRSEVMHVGRVLMEIGMYFLVPGPASM